MSQSARSRQLLSASRVTACLEELTAAISAARRYQLAIENQDGKRGRGGIEFEEADFARSRAHDAAADALKRLARAMAAAGEPVAWAEQLSHPRKELGELAREIATHPYWRERRLRA